MVLLHRTRWLTRLVLAWFVFALGAAIASPMVKPQALDVVCSASGAFKLVVLGDEGASPDATAAMDCPLCLPAAVPPVSSMPLAVMVPAATPNGFRPDPVRIVLRAAAPLPPRGPPVLS